MDFQEGRFLREKLDDAHEVLFSISVRKNEHLATRQFEQLKLPETIQANVRHALFSLSLSRQVLKLPEIVQANVRHASACRRLPNVQAPRNAASECPICFISLSSRYLTLKQRGIAQRMSDMLQLVVEVPNTQATWNCSTLTGFRGVEFWGRQRQAEAYRTFVESLQR